MIGDAIRTALDTITPNGWDPSAVYIILVCLLILFWVLARSTRRL